jgi:LuxR family maltose regulon positive regulatory protein
MLDTSVLGQLTADACAAVTGRPDAEALLRAIDTAHLFLVALDDELATFRYHRLVRQVLHAELRARDRDREHLLQQRAAEWYEAAGDTTRATRHFFAANQAGRALDLMQDRVVTDFLQLPVVPGALDLAVLAPAALAGSPDQLLTVAADLLIHGNITRAGDYLDLLGQTQPPGALEPRPAYRLAALQCFYYALTGAVAEAEGAAGRARAIQERTGRTDEWDAVVPLTMLRVYACLGDVKAVARETDAALSAAGLTEPARLVELPGAQALACFEAGHLADAAVTAGAAGASAERLGFDRHFFGVDYLRALAGLALEQRDIDTAERLTEQTISITEHQRPIFEFLALLDRAAIWATRGQTREALASVDAARDVLPGTRSPLLARADETEALLQLFLGDLDSPATLATRLPAIPRAIMRARIALAAGDHHAAQEHLQSPSLGDLTPRRALVRQLLLAAAAIERGDPMTASIVGGVLQAARGEGFINTVVTTAPQVTGYLIEHSTQLRPDPFVKRLIAAALDAHATQPGPHQPGNLPTVPLTPAELRILRLLPTSTYLQMADTLYVSRNTVKTHLRSIYQKLCVESRAQAIERAVELRLL